MKKICSGILAILLCASIAGCGKIENTTNKSSSNDLSSNTQVETEKPSNSSEKDNDKDQSLESTTPSDDKDTEPTP